MGKIGQDIISRRGVDRDTFCEGCGYNLRTLPQIGRCPECGGEYDTRPMHAHGIWLPKDLRVPADVIGSMLLSGLLAYVFIRVAVRDKVYWAHFAGFAFGLMFGLFVWISFRRTVRLLRYRALLRRAGQHGEDPP